MHLQGFDTAEEMIAALYDGSLKICDVHEWGEATYNSPVSQPISLCRVSSLV